MPRFGKTHDVLDNGAQPPPLAAYAFTPEANGVIAGCYIDIEGNQVGGSWSAALTSGASFTLYTLSNDPPDGAVGFLGRCTANLRTNRSGAKTAPFISDAPTAAKNAQIAATERLVLGRVNG